MATRFMNPRLRYVEPAAAGENGDQPGGAGAAPPSPADAAAAAAAGGAAPAAPAAAGTLADQITVPVGIDVTGWPQAAVDAGLKEQNRAASFQREAATSRVNSKTKAADAATVKAIRDIAAQVGVELPEDAPTVDSLGAQLQTITTERDTNAAERDAALSSAAIVREAMKQGIAPAKLSYLEFMLSSEKTLAGIGPTDDKFGGKLAAAIAAKVAEDATLKLAGSVQASGAENFGGAGGNATITKEQFANMDLLARSKLFKTDKATYDALVAQTL